MKLGSVPVIYQDFETEEQEYAAGISDNGIASWAELDLAGINADIENLDGSQFDLNLLGIENFDLDPKPKPATKKEQTCPECGHQFIP